MKTSASSRKVVNLPDSVRQRLHTYTLAASAAGVTMLALAPPAEAEIIYTPVQQNLTLNLPYALDLTGDGTTDFILSATISTGPDGFSDALGVEPAQAENAAATVAGKFFDYAAALPSGHLIGPKAKFAGSYPNRLPMATGWNFSSTHSRGHCRGAWNNKQNRYLGLKFMLSGEVHYGWARLSETCDRGYISAELTGYAYETVPNKNLKAGQETGDLDESLNGPGKPSQGSAPVPTAVPLGMLAQGAPALDIWRRE